MKRENMKNMILCLTITLMVSKTTLCSQGNASDNPLLTSLSFDTASQNNDAQGNDALVQSQQQILQAGTDLKIEVAKAKLLGVLDREGAFKMIKNARLQYLEAIDRFSKE